MIGELLRCHQAEHNAGITAGFDHRHYRLPLGLHLDGVIERTSGGIDIAADQRLQALGATAKVGDLDVKAGILEVAEALREGERKVDHERLAADRDLDVCLFGLGIGAKYGGRHRQRGAKRRCSNKSTNIPHHISSRIEWLYRRLAPPSSKHT